MRLRCCLSGGPPFAVSPQRRLIEGPRIVHPNPVSSTPKSRLICDLVAADPKDRPSLFCRQGASSKGRESYIRFSIRQARISIFFRTACSVVRPPGIQQAALRKLRLHSPAARTQQMWRWMTVRSRFCQMVCAARARKRAPADTARGAPSPCKDHLRTEQRFASRSPSLTTPIGAGTVKQTVMCGR